MITQDMIDLAKAIVDGNCIWEVLSDACEDAGYPNVFAEHRRSNNSYACPSGPNCPTLQHILANDEEKFLHLYKQDLLESDTATD